MVSAGDFKKGVTFEMDDHTFTVIEFQHVKPGKGAAFVRTKIRNVITGAVVEKSFNPTERYPKAQVETREMEYLYEDGGLYYFMDLESYEQIPLNLSQVEEALKYLKENDIATVKSLKGVAFSVAAPNFVELEVVKTDPGFKGDTATGANKPATVETGAIITVPLFVEQGDKIRIDTRTGDYMERV